jgi:hypothetical protein
MSVPHRLSQDEALNRVKNRLGQLKAQHSDRISNLQEYWNGNFCTFSGSAMGIVVAGSLIVTPSEVIIQGTLPLLAMPIRGKIEARIRAEIDSILM